MLNQQRDIEILYQDSELVVINKPGGLLSVPGRGPEKQDCAASRLRHRFSKMIAQPAVHRLDMFTSGLMVFAITANAHRYLSGQFEKRAVVKKYTAIIEGTIGQTCGDIHLAFRLDPNNRPLQVYDPDHGKMGITKWRKLENMGNRTRIEFTPLTGRTHQLRVHAAHPRPMGLGAPIAGDSLYGQGKEGDQMMLHASYLQFIHPETCKPLEFHSLSPF